MQPFETGVWLLTFGATVVVALVIMLLEYPWGRPGGAAGGQAERPGLHEVWSRYGRCEMCVGAAMDRSPDLWDAIIRM